MFNNLNYIIFSSHDRSKIYIISFNLQSDTNNNKTENIKI